MSSYRDFRGNRPWPLEGEDQECSSGSSLKVYSEKKICYYFTGIFCLFLSQPLDLRIIESQRI